MADKIPEMHMLAVGKPAVPGVTSWVERAEYAWRDNGHRLHVFWKHPSGKEVSAIQKDPMQFALYVEGDVIVFLYRLGSVTDWSDAPYTIHMEAEADIPPEPETEKHRAMLTVLLVDAATGILRAMRVLSLSPDFTRKLHAAIRAQAGSAFDQDAYERHVERIYARNNPAMLAAKAIARCYGGE